MNKKKFIEINFPLVLDLKILVDSFAKRKAKKGQDEILRSELENFLLVLSFVCWFFWWFVGREI